MIKLDQQREASCKCGKPAWHREVEVRSPHNARRVSYECHAEVTDGAHTARLVEVDGFIAEMDALVAAANQNLPALAKGTLKAIDLSYQLPDACSPFGLARPLVVVAGFGQGSEVTLEPVDIAKTTPTALQALAVEGAMKEMERLEANFKLGRF